MKITETMVKELNQQLKDHGCIFRYDYNSFNSGNPRIQRVPASGTFITSAIINCTVDFYKYLEGFFRNRGINKLNYNNDGSICWSASGWDGIGDMVQVRCISIRQANPKQITVGELYYICESSRWVDVDGDTYVEVYADKEKQIFIGNMLELHFEVV